MSNITKFSGKITFYEDQIRINTTNGIDPTYTSGPSWDLGGNHTLILDGITPTHIMSVELKKNVFSSEIILQSRFHGEIHMKALGKKEAQEAERLINERRSNSGFSKPDNNNKGDR